MTTTPTASPELPDLDKLEALARAATAGPWLHRRDPGNPIGAQHCVKLAGEHGAWVCDCIDNADRSTVGGIAGERNAAFIACAHPAAVLALIALARRAQPESEAPQADWIGALVLDVAELPDRDSPEEWPEAMLVTGDELRTLIALHAPPASLSPFCGAQPAQSGKETAQLSIGFANNDQGVHVSVMQRHPDDAITLLHQAKVPAGDSFAHFSIAVKQAAVPRTDLSKRIRAAATADVTLAQAKLLIGAAEEIERAQQAAAPGALDDLDFTPDAHHQVADMANVGYELMQTIKALRPDYCWNDTPAEIVSDLINELDEATAGAPGTPEAPKGGAQLLAELLGAPSLYSQVYVAATVGQGWAGPAAKDAADAAVQEYGDSPAVLVEDLQSILDEVLRVDGAAQLNGGQEGSESNG